MYHKKARDNYPLYAECIHAALENVFKTLLHLLVKKIKFAQFMVQVSLVRIICIANVGFLDEVIGEKKIRFRFDKPITYTKT